MSAKLIQVIETHLERRGNGKDDPVRILTQYWSVEGVLLAEVDPLPPKTQGTPSSRCPVGNNDYQCILNTGHLCDHDWGK